MAVEVSSSILNADLSSINYIIDNLSGFHAIAKASPDQEELYFIVNRYLDYYSARSYISSDVRAAITKLKNIYPQSLLNPQYLTAVENVFGVIRTEIRTDIEKNNTQSAASVPENLKELVKLHQEHLRQNVEAQQWRELLDTQIKNYNQKIINNITVDVETNDALKNTRYTEPENLDFVAAKISTYVRNEQKQKTETARIDAVYEGLVASLSLDVRTGRTTYEQMLSRKPTATGAPIPVPEIEERKIQIAQSAARTLTLLGIPTVAPTLPLAQQLDPTTQIPTPQEVITPAQSGAFREIVHRQLATAIVESRYLTARGENADDTAKRLSTIERGVVMPALFRGGKTKPEVIDGKKAQEGYVTQADLLPEQRQAITRRLNSFQQKIQSGMINSEAMLAAEQSNLFDSLKKDTGMDKKELPVHIQNSIKLIQLKGGDETSLAVFKASVDAFSKGELPSLEKNQDVYQKAFTQELYAYRDERAQLAQGKTAMGASAALSQHERNLFDNLRLIYPYLSDAALSEMLAGAISVPITINGVLYGNVHADTLTTPPTTPTISSVESYRREMRGPTPSRIPEMVVEGQFPQFGPEAIGAPSGGMLPSFPPLSANNDPLTNSIGRVGNALQNAASLGENARTGAEALGVVGRGILTQWWFLGIIAGAFALFGFINIQFGNMMANFIPLSSNERAAGGAGPSANYNIGTCPLVGGDGNISVTSLNTATETGHGSTRYWGGSTSGSYAIPINGMYPQGCYDRACPYYGYAIDVRGTAGQAVVLPRICSRIPTENGAACDGNHTWRVVTVFYNCRGASTPDKASCPQGGWGWGAVFRTTDGQWQLYLNHMETSVQTGQTYESGDQVGGLSADLGANTHLHIEINWQGTPERPEFLCDGSSNIGSGDDSIGDIGNDGRPIGGGRCTVPTTGYCSVNDPVTNLGELFGTQKNNAAQVCITESGGYTGSINRGCFTGRTAEYSVGLFQINILVHTPNDLRSQGIRCNDAFSMSNGYNRGSVCTIVNQEIFDTCRNYFLDPENNARYARDLYNGVYGGGGWGPWSAATACGIVN